MYGFEGVGLSEVQLSISELSVVGGWVVVTGQTHFIVGPGRSPTKIPFYTASLNYQEDKSRSAWFTLSCIRYESIASFMSRI